MHFRNDLGSLNLRIVVNESGIETPNKNARICRPVIY